MENDNAWFWNAVSELFREWCRLTNSPLGKPRVPLIQMIDAATGTEAEELRKFAAFIKDVVFDRLPPETALLAAAQLGLLGEPWGES